MTKAQALAAMRKRFGAKSRVEKRGASKWKDGRCSTCRLLDCARPRYYVGHILSIGELGFGFYVDGIGHSWAEAVAQAEYNERADRERFAKLRAVKAGAAGGDLASNPNARNREEP